MEKISLFGHGFIGREFSKTYPQEVEVVPRGSLYSPTNNILYGISTVHNYHPKDGDPFIDIDTNLVHFMKVLDNNINEETVFNLISTWFVYGKNGRLPASEDDLCNPMGFYSITSFAREKLLQSYCETFGLKYRILRLGSVIGIGDKKASLKKNAIQGIIKELSQGRDVTIYESTSIRDFIDVRDCARAIHLVLEKGELNQIYNIANGQGLSVRELIDVAHRESEYRAKINTMKVPRFHEVIQTPKMFLDVRKIKSLGYIKQHDIKTTVKELVHYYEHNEV